MSQLTEAETSSNRGVWTFELWGHAHVSFREIGRLSSQLILRFGVIIEKSPNRVTSRSSLRSRSSGRSLISGTSETTGTRYPIGTLFDYDSESEDELGAQSPNFSERNMSVPPKLKRPDTPITRRLSFSELGHTSPPTVKAMESLKEGQRAQPATRGAFTRGTRSSKTPDSAKKPTKKEASPKDKVVCALVSRLVTTSSQIPHLRRTGCHPGAPTHWSSCTGWSASSHRSADRRKASTRGSCEVDMPAPQRKGHWYRPLASFAFFRGSATNAINHNNHIDASITDSVVEKRRLFHAERRRSAIQKKIIDASEELHIMIPLSQEEAKNSGTKQEPRIEGEICLLTDSPYRILRAAESGNLEDFNKLFSAEPARLGVRDSKGRAAAHQAAARNKVNILQFIANHGGDLSIRDHVGNTPLHIAVEYEALDVIEYLLQAGVDTSILNNKQQAPIHIATELNRVSVLQLMAKYKDRIDMRQGGEHGRTALHLAAIYDHDQCAKILISELGACPRRPCNNGYYPIHEAAKNASSRTMEVFLQWGESRGCSREEMISFYDAEGNVPLHSAVHSGDFKAVELCLKSGAKISTQQHDLSTPVHLACAQGAIDIVRLMFGLQPQEKALCLQSCDVQKMTPLHCAAMFDRAEIVQFLIQEGADINAMDKERRSPLLLAASRGGWRTVLALIRLKANIHLKDFNHRNILHLVVMNGGRLDEFATEVIKAQSTEDLQELLNEKDNMGCSPLHFASREGHTRVVQLLLNRGALLHRDHNGRNPLHLAAMCGYTQTIELLHSVHSHLLDQVDKDGNTALHLATMENKPNSIALLLSMECKLLYNHIDLSAIDYAIYYKFPEAALAMVTHDSRAQEVMALRSDKHPCVTLALIASMPKVFESVQDKCITKANCKKDSKSFYIKYNFSCLQCPRYNQMNKKSMSSGEPHTLQKPIPLPALNAMVVHGRVELLAHPLSQKYLQMKWNSYGKYFHCAHLLFYMVFLIFVTYFSSKLMDVSRPIVSNTTKSIDFQRTYLQYAEINMTEEQMMIKAAMYTSAVIICIYIVLSSLREVLQLYQQRWQYLLDPTNLVSWMLYISSLTMVMPLLTGQTQALVSLQVSCASITVFLTWFTLLLNLQSNMLMYVIEIVGLDTGMTPNQMPVYFKYIFRAMPVVMFPVIIHFEGIILVYWLSTNFITLVQTSVLKITPVRDFFGIPRVVPFRNEFQFATPGLKAAETEKQSFTQGLKESYSNIDKSYEIEERKRIDDLIKQQGLRAKAMESKSASTK
ncbi:hypothetical protein LSTR_LSTR003886 [Laodelphax striatellus]|uniref:Uncharacterized protein n=1 Tax=Laodelphax striatellus TaxID=195883 RepID=A0A482XEJ3_LAOST|nr:hypothetical protein LSTR_LSTR003886 [Laodelphax striatellus]